MDHQGNIYVASGDEMIKYSRGGQELARYGNKLYGKISDVDVRDPLKVMLWYADLGQIVWLDNFFAVRGTPIPLEASNMDQVSMVTSSRDNCFWVFDERERQISRLNNKLELVANSGNLELLTGINIVPTRMMERNNRLYVRDASGILIVMDIYASYQRTLKVHAGNDFNIVDGKLLYAEGDSIHVEDIDSMTEQVLPLRITNPLCGMAAFSTNIVAVRCSDRIIGLPIIY